MSIVLQGSTSGSITLQEPAVAGSTVLSLPATTGTVLTSASPASDLPSSIKGPAFSAYNNASQTINHNTSTKIQLNQELFDTNNCFDATTNYRFTPTVAGYYLVNANIYFGATLSRNYYFETTIYKNGSKVQQFAKAYNYPSTGTVENSVNGSAIVYLNGSTDYIEMYGYFWDYTASGTVSALSSGSVLTSLSASLIRSA